MKAGNAHAIRHDPDFLNFVLLYEERYDMELSYEKAVQLYMDYDTQWRSEVNEAAQFRRFARDRHRNPMKEFAHE